MRADRLAARWASECAKLGVVSEPEEILDKAQKVRRLVAAGQVTPPILPYIVGELLAEVDAKASDYRDWLKLASECFAKLGHPRRAALTLALGVGPEAALKCLPSDLFPRERAYLLAAQAKAVPGQASGLLHEAAQLCLSAGLLTSAGLLFQQAGEVTLAKDAWTRLLGTQPPLYERALLHAQLALLGSGESPSELVSEGRRHAALSGQLLEEVADGHELGGRRAQALDCYRVLAQLGERRGAFENIAEGFLGMLRIFQGERMVAEAVALYDELLRLAIQHGEHELCAEQCREAAQFLIRCGLPGPAGGYLRQAAQALLRVAEGRAQAGALRLAEHALLSAADLLSGLPEPGLLGDVLRRLAASQRDPHERARYTRLADKLPTASGAKPVEPVTKPAGQSSRGLPEVWTLDLLAWEAAASPAAVCLRLLLDPSRPELTRRHALLVLLYIEGDATQALPVEQRQRLVRSLGSQRVYEAVAPLQRLYHESLAQAERPGEATLRGQIVDALPKLPFPRALQLVVEALGDPSEAVRSQAHSALSRMGTSELLSTLGQLLSESREPAVQLALVSALSRVADPRAVERLLAVFCSQGDPLRREARRGLVGLRDKSLRPLYARALLTVSSDRAQDLHALISELYPSGL